MAPDTTEPAFPATGVRNVGRPRETSGSEGVSANRPKRGEGMADSLGADAGAGLKALGINCTLKRTPEVSNTEALMLRVLGILGEHGVEKIGRASCRERRWCGVGR